MNENIDKIITLIHSKEAKLDGYVIVKGDQMNVYAVDFNDDLAKHFKVKFKEIINTNLKNSKVGSIADMSNEQYDWIDIDITVDFNPTKGLMDDSSIDGNKFSWTKPIYAFIFKVSKTNEKYYMFQKVFSASKVNSEKRIILNRDEQNESFLKKENKDLYIIENRIDWFVIGDKVIANTDRLKDLHNDFGLNDHIKSINNKLIDDLDKLDMFGDVSSIKKLVLENSKLAKNFISIKNSPVLKMDKNLIISRVSEIHRYSSLIKEEKIVAASQNSIKLLIKMLKDDILKSQLTELEYDARSKEQLE